MRRWNYALLSLGAACGLLLVTTAPASASSAIKSPHKIAQSISGRDGLGAGTLTTRVSRTLHFTLPERQCVALRRSSRNSAEGCGATASYHLTVVRSAAGPGQSTYAKGYVVGCSEAVGNGSACVSWHVENDFSATWIYGVGIWKNTVSCPAGRQWGTNVTWCGYYDNGQSIMQFGINFGKDGYVRLPIDDEGNTYNTEENSWVLTESCLIPGGGDLCW